MTEREKMIEIVLDTEITGIKLRNITGGISTANAIADALIAAGIDDTTNLTVENEVLQRDVENLTRTLEEGREEFQEAQHRAEVAKRQAVVLSKWLAEKTRNYPWLVWFDAAQKKAEREIEEEGKDE